MNNTIEPPQVAPLVGAWIEIDSGISPTLIAGVAPLVGAWIEIVNALDMV